MTEVTTIPNGTASPAAPRPMQRILSQYIRDLSFENLLAQKGLTGETQQEVGIQVALDAHRKGGEKDYEVAIKLKITNTSKLTGETLFLLEIDYAGLFHIEGIQDRMMEPYLFVECPRLLFPFLRRIVSDLTRDGGFPSLSLDSIDFAALFRKELATRTQTARASAR